MGRWSPAEHRKSCVRKRARAVWKTRSCGSSGPARGWHSERGSERVPEGVPGESARSPYVDLGADLRPPVRAVAVWSGAVAFHLAWHIRGGQTGHLDRIACRARTEPFDSFAPVRSQSRACCVRRCRGTGGCTGAPEAFGAHGDGRLQLTVPGIPAGATAAVR